MITESNQRWIKWKKENRQKRKKKGGVGGGRNIEVIFGFQGYMSWFSTKFGLTWCITIGWKRQSNDQRNPSAKHEVEGNFSFSFMEIKLSEPHGQNSGIKERYIYIYNITQNQQLQLLFLCVIQGVWACGSDFPVASKPKQPSKWP